MGHCSGASRTAGGGLRTVCTGPRAAEGRGGPSIPLAGQRRCSGQSHVREGTACGHRAEVQARAQPCSLSPTFLARSLRNHLAPARGFWEDQFRANGLQSDVHLSVMAATLRR